MFLFTGKWCDAVAPPECLAAAYEYLVAGQDRGVEHGYVGWELCHRKGGFRYVLGCYGGFVGGGGWTCVATFGRHVDKAGMQATCGYAEGSALQKR